MRPNIEWRGVPFVTGIFTTIIQFLAGVGGLFLDIFFQKSQLDRKTTNATKAITQTFSHVLRARLFRLARRHRRSADRASGGRRSCWRWSARCSRPIVLERMTDHGFRRWTPRDHLHASRRSIWSAAAGCSGRRLRPRAARLRSRSGEHLDLAVERHQAGLDLERRLLLVPPACGIRPARCGAVSVSVVAVCRRLSAP